MEDVVNQIDEIKAEIAALIRKLTAIADENGLLVYVSDVLPAPRGAGGMVYYGKNHPERHSEDVGHYYSPEDFGGWLSSATEEC